MDNRPDQGHTMTVVEPDVAEADDPIGWVPDPRLTTHAGQPIGPDSEFFAAPPVEIGPVLSAFSTLRAGKRSAAAVSRLAIAGFAGSAGVAALHFAGVEGAWQVVGFVALALAAWALTRVVPSCTYVGRDGLARFRWRGGGGGRIRAESFAFGDAVDLRTVQTRHYHNGIYTGTQYKFRWTDAAGRPVFKLAGTYRGEKKPPGPRDPFHFATAAEAAWTVHRLLRVLEELREAGLVRFGLGGEDWVGLGPGFLEWHRKGQTERCEAGEVGRVTLDAGTVRVERVDAKVGWFGSTGVWKIPYANMANGQVFLVLVQELLGVPLG